ncbi:hypothetical protein V8F20_001496 [Naviculisporaceae sp. PSN 640]
MSVWEKYLPETRVKWEPYRHGCPIWPSDPDLDAVKEILASELLDSDRKDDSEMDVKFLADGASHKVYEADHPSWTSTYLLRVAIAVDPCLKTESEMATLEFLRQKTSIPVPKVIAWSSSADNKLGYEWSIMEKVPGVELRTIWYTMPWDKKVNLVRKLAMYMAQLWDKGNRFSQIGSLYLTDGASGITPRRVRTTDIREPTFSIGPVIDHPLYARRRLQLKPNRGPYESSEEWLIALAETERDFIKTAKLLIDAREQAPEHYRKDDEAWTNTVDEEIFVDSEDFLTEYQALMSCCAEVIDFIPSLYPKSTIISATTQPTAGETDGKYILFNRDIRGANILVDPVTFEINAIIDWETTAAFPAWFSLNYPLLIDWEAPFTETEVRIPTEAEYDEESEEYNPCVIDNRERWEARILRKEFDRELEMLGWAPGWQRKFASPIDQLKHSVLLTIPCLNDGRERATKCLENIREEWKNLELKRKELEEQAWKELQEKVAVRDKHRQELLDLIAKQEDEYNQLLATWEEKKRAIEDKHAEKDA